MPKKITSRKDAYKFLVDSQKYLKYHDDRKFPIKARKYLPEETLISLAAIEASLQVGYRLCPVKEVIRQLENLKQHDKTSRGRLIDDTIDKCIRIFESIIQNGVE